MPTTNEPRPMSEYESALFAAVSVLLSAVVELGVKPDELVQRFQVHREDFKTAGQSSAAATMDLLIRYAQPPR